MNQSNEERMQQLLCAYVLDEVTDAERVEVEAALAGSAELRAEKERFEGTIALVAGAFEGAEELSSDSVQALNVAAGGGGRILQGPWYRKPSVRFAAAVLVVIGAYGASKLIDSSGEAKRDDLVAKVDLNVREELARSAPATEDAAKESTVALRRSIVDSQAEGEPVETDFAVDQAQSAKIAERLARAELRSTNSNSPQKDAPGETLLQLEKKGWIAPPEEAAEPGTADLFYLGEGLADAGELLSGGQPVPATKSAERQGGNSKVVSESPSVGAVGSTGGGGYKGPGDAVPQGRAKPGALTSSKVRMRASTSLGKKAKGSGGPSSPGAAGPSSPGPAQPLATPSSNSSTPVPVTLEVRERIALDSLGYAYAEDFFLDEENEEVGSDDAFELDRRKRELGGPAASSRVRIPLTSDQIDAATEERCGVIFRSCRPRPNESPRDMFFRYYGDNPFVVADEDKLSTFAADVDTSSYVLVRNYLKNRHLPTKAQVRTEEFVNYFRPDVEAPTEGVFNIASELAPSRFSAQPGRWMLRVAVRGREVAREERKPLNLTFVTDTSGSMKEQNRMELVKHALRLLVTQLDARDSISIVGFSTEATVVLPMTSAANRGVIESAIYSLQPDGGTNPEAGLLAGYAIAAQALSQNSHNRVVLLSDGVGNIGETDQNRLTDKVKAQRELGIYLNTIGVGMNNHNDEFLEQLANKGDGLSNYIDDELEARRALVENFTGTFEPIARDVKIQVEFDSNQVYRYRQLGYENRAIADADFRNDKVDAGEIGAGHQVVCLYELELDPSYNGDSVSPLATVRLRYKQPSGAGRHPAEDSATEITHVVRGGGTSFEGTSAGFRRSVIAAQFAEILRRSEHARGDSITDVIAAAAKLAPEVRDADFQEMLDLMSICRGEILKRNQGRTELSERISDLRYHHLRMARYEPLGSESDQTTTEDLEQLGAELEESIRRIIRSRIAAEQEPVHKVR